MRKTTGGIISRTKSGFFQRDSDQPKNQNQLKIEDCEIKVLIVKNCLGHPNLYGICPYKMKDPENITLIGA